MNDDSTRLLSQVESANQAVEREQIIVSTELELYQRFGDRIQQLETTEDSTGSDQTIATTSKKLPPTGNPRTNSDQSVSTLIQTAYEDTVMAASHYDEEYGDTVVEGLVNDFGRPLMNVVVSDQPFTPLVKSRLLHEIDAAIENRQTLCQKLDREKSALQIAEEELEHIREEIFAIESRPLFECSRSELNRLAEDITALENQCDELLARRQSGDLHSTNTLLRSSGGVSFADYLYEPLDCHYPILRTVADASSQLNRIQTRLKTAQQTRDKALP